MNRSITSRIAAAVLAIGTIGAAAVANASTAVHVPAGVPAATAPLYVYPEASYVPAARTMHVPPQVAYDEPRSYAHDWRYEHNGRNWRSSCRAPGWDPNARYMPGQRVWHNGYLFVATPLSASVWNVNSPPEWTPSYWAPMRCR